MDPAREIENAVRAYEDRKEAVYEGDRSAGAIHTDVMRTLLVGLDLSIEELAEFRVAASAAAMEVFGKANERTGDARLALAHTFAGTWVDGVVTGMLIQQAREE